MKQIGLLGLCFGILISGVRGQEVITKNSLTGGMPAVNSPMLLQEGETMEILSFTLIGGGELIGGLRLVSIDWDSHTSPEWWTFPNTFLTLCDSRYNFSYTASTPIILSGPAKVIFENLTSIAYRVVPKAGYSPNISPASLASNTNFVSGLTQTILSNSNSYGLATRTQLIQALAESRADGINSVISNPNLWTLYTTNQIHAMAIGDLVLTSTNNGQFVLNYDIEQSEDLVNWTPYQGFALPLTNLPTNKAFVRIKAKQ